MRVTRHAPKRRTVFLGIVFGLAALLVIGTFGQGADGSFKPRNNPDEPQNGRLGEIHGANPVNDCLSHHRGEGMFDTHLIFPILPIQFQIDRVTEFPIQIINPWKQELRNMSLEVTLLEEPLMRILEAEDASEGPLRDQKLQYDFVLGPKENRAPPPAPPDPLYDRKIEFEIPPGASVVFVSVRLRPDNVNTTFEDISNATGGELIEKDHYRVRWDFDEFGPYIGGDIEEPDEASLVRNFTFQPQGGGKKSFTVAHHNGSSRRTQVDAEVDIIMGGGAQGKTYRVPVPIQRIPKNSGDTMMVKVEPFRQGEQKMLFALRAGPYYKHQDRSTPTQDFYTRVQNLSSSEDLIVKDVIYPTRAPKIGTNFIPSPFQAASVSTDNAEDWKIVIGEVSGFSAGILLLPSLLLGGTYGKTSRRALNKMLGGAKRRVMFHNLVSLGLSLVAIVHIVLFMLEIRYTILMGVLWGGFGAVSLLILGLTGYYQVPLIQRHGYNWWRTVHLVTGLLVVLFVSYHSIADGADFYFIKEQLPQWVNDVNFAQK